MTDFESKGKSVPSGRMSRFAKFGGMAARVAGSMAVSGAKELASGRRPKVQDLLLTPANARRVTGQLSNMRGAAMKIGQMLSMESGDFLPKELADILAKLRADGQHMPVNQLEKVLEEEWGEGWIEQFHYFKFTPIAAASIGQVHRAYTHDGEPLAIKVQYPGVKDSIDSDIKNVSTLLRMTGLIPPELEIDPFIEVGRRQLHEEADYIREAEYLTRFGELLADDDNFVVPDYFPEFSTDTILTMSYLQGEPIEAMSEAPQETRDRIMHLLLELVLRELFEFGVMQTDPNFANYQYDTETHQIVLLDFGASRDITPEIAGTYRTLMHACMSGDREAVYAATQATGFMPLDLSPELKEAMMELIELATYPFWNDEVFDYGNNENAGKLRDKAMPLAGVKELWHLPPPGIAFIQRKLGGMYMLATKLRARVNVYALMREYVGEP